MQNEETRKREVSALMALNKLYPLKRALIITFDEEETITDSDVPVEVIPVWKWLLM